MINLYDKESGALVGQITDAQLQFLVDQLEEESAGDTDYYINEDTLDLLEERGADAALLAALRKALGGREERDLRWARA